MEKAKTSAFRVLSNQEIIAYGFLRSLYRGDFIISAMGAFMGFAVTISMLGFQFGMNSETGMAGNAILFMFLISMLTTLGVPIIPILFGLPFVKGTVVRCEKCRSVFQEGEAQKIRLSLYGGICHHNIWSLERKDGMSLRALLWRTLAHSGQKESDLCTIEERVRKEQTTLRALSGREILLYSFFRSLRNGAFAVALAGTIIGALVGVLTMNVEVRASLTGIALMLFIGLVVTLFSPFIYILVEFPFLRGELLYCEKCGGVFKKGYIMRTQFTECERHGGVWESEFS